MRYLKTRVSATFCLHGHLHLRFATVDSSLASPSLGEVRKVLVKRDEMRCPDMLKPVTSYCHGFRVSLKSALWEETWVRGFVTYIPRHMQPSR